MNILKKIVVWILCLSLIISIFASAAYTAFAADSSDFEKDTDTAYATLDYPYFEFTNIVAIERSDEYIVVTQLINEGLDTEYLEYVVFDSDGEYERTLTMTSAVGDVQKIEIYNYTAVSLNYLADDTSMLYSNMLTDYALSYAGDYVTMQSDGAPIIRDFTIIDDTLYYIKVATKDSVKSVKLSGGKTVATIIGAETDVDIPLSGFSAIESCGDDLIIEVEYSDLYHYDTSTGETTLLSGLPSEEILQFGGYNNHVFILTSGGVYYRDITTSDSFELLLGVSSGTSTDSNLVDPVAFTVYYENSAIKLLIADNEGAMAVKGFSLSSGMLLSNMFSIYSFSASEQGYNTPTDISSSYKSYVVADSENNRVKVIDEDGDIKSYYLLDSNGTAISPIYAGIDYQENIYVITDDDRFLVYTSSGNLQYFYTEYDGTSFSNISGLEVSPYDCTCYFLSKSSIIAYDGSTGELSSPVPNATTGNGLAVDYYNNYIGVYDINSMNVYSLVDGELIYAVSSLNNSGFCYDVEFDLGGNFYVLSSNDSSSTVSKYSMADEDSNNYDQYEITYERVSAFVYNSDNNSNFVMMTINLEDEVAYFIKEGEHRVYETDELFDYFDISYNVEIDIPSDIFQKEEVSDVVILDVLAEGNRLLLPVSQNDDIYPSGYAIIRPIKLSENSKVIVTGVSDDGEIYYVLYNNSVGFMYASSLAETEDDAELPFEDALTLHDNTYIYKYPLSTTSGMVPLYGFAQLEKDTTLTIINLANDYVCPMGMLWYRVEAEVDGEIIVGYMPRYNVVENSSETDSTYEYGRINANLFEGYATVYADEGVTELGTKIYDGEKVEIMAERGDYYYVREVNPTGDVATEGYVLKSLVTTDAQTRSFTIAVILIIVLLIALAVIIVVKIQLKKRRR